MRLKLEGWPAAGVKGGKSGVSGDERLVQKVPAPSEERIVLGIKAGG